MPHPYLTRWLQQRRSLRITPGYARARARRGAAYLDEMHPGWYRRIDTSTLALADGSACVLGQLHGEYRLGLGRSALLNLGSAPLGNSSPVDMGFQCVAGVSVRDEERDYRYLDAAWSEEVRQRRRHDAQVVDDLLRVLARDEREESPLSAA